MKSLTWFLVLPLTIISMVLFTKWWYVFPDDAPDTFMAGFPLPFIADAWHTSMAFQIFLLEFIVDMAVYFFFWFALVFIVNRYIKKIRMHRFLKGTMITLALLVTISIVYIGSFPGHVYTMRRDWNMKVVATGYKLTWQHVDRTPLTKIAFPRMDRQRLIEELIKLRDVVASNDKEQIANVFELPVDDSLFGIYMEDNVYHEKVKANNNQLSKEIFLQHYAEIQQVILVDEMNELFKNIHLDSLKYKDTLSFDAYKPAEPCYHAFQVAVDSSEVTLTISGRSNDNFLSKKSSDEVPENDSSMCEFSVWWTFTFDGNKLRFKLISGAG